MNKEDKAAYDREYHKRNKAKKVAAAKAWAEAHPDRVQKFKDNWVRKNPDRHRRLVSEWNRRNRDRVRHSWVKRKYGLTTEQHDAMLIEQNFKCAFSHCEATVDLYSPIDHSHVSGKVRGILCSGHNAGLGFFEKRNLQCLLDAHAYVEKFDVI
jgi:hypothetical protein